MEPEIETAIDEANSEFSKQNPKYPSSFLRKVTRHKIGSTGGFFLKFEVINDVEDEKDHFKYSASISFGEFRHDKIVEDSIKTWEKLHEEAMQKYSSFSDELRNF